MNILHRRFNSLKFTGFVFSLFLMLSTISQAQEGDPAKGKDLFMTNCTACHKLDEKFVGPSLKGVADRRSEDYIFNMVTNSTEWVKTNPDAQKLFEEYNQTPMTPFPQFTREDVQNIIAYTTVGDEGLAQDEPQVVTTAVSSEEYSKLPPTNSNWWWQPVVVLLLAALLYFFAKKKMGMFLFLCYMP